MNKYKEEMKYNFPISENQAIEIAERNENLKTDYCKHTNRGAISYLSFEDRKVDLVEIYNKKYWQIQILAGDVSGMSVTDKEDYCWDGWLGKDDLKKLRCLIDVQTGEYIYYPVNNKKMKKWIRNIIYMIFIVIIIGIYICFFR